MSARQHECECGAVWDCDGCETTEIEKLCAECIAEDAGGEDRPLEWLCGTCGKDLHKGNQMYECRAHFSADLSRLWWSAWILLWSWVGERRRGSAIAIDMVRTRPILTADELRRFLYDTTPESATISATETTYSNSVEVKK